MCVACSSEIDSPLLWAVSVQFRVSISRRMSGQEQEISVGECVCVYIQRSFGGLNDSFSVFEKID